MQVSNGVMTTNTTGLRIAGVGMWTFDRFHYFLMTFSTSLFSHCAATLSDVNVVVKPTGGEVIRMPETVLCFRRIFAHDTRRRMAIVADSNSAVA